MTTSPIRTAPHIIYPDSDGPSMADNTQQFRWIVLIKENLELKWHEGNIAPQVVFEILSPENRLK